MQNECVHTSLGRASNLPKKTIPEGVTPYSYNIMYPISKRKDIKKVCLTNSVIVSMIFSCKAIQ